MREPNYDKYPSTLIDGPAVMGWSEIADFLRHALDGYPVWAIELIPIR